jgi:HSP90 family molecular chaperone
MAFRVAARTLLHLGAELISSDGVALYELVKNAFDSHSKRVVIEVLRPLKQLPERLASALTDENVNHDKAITDDLREGILAAIDLAAPGAAELSDSVRTTEDIETLRKLVRVANAITVEDWGHGMSLRELDDVYLTIGTRSRLKDREASDQPVLGEKGLGRLAVMRLGQRLRVVTSRESETHWNEFTHWRKTRTTLR